VIPFLGANLWRSLALALAGVCISLLMWIFGLPLIGGGLLAKVDRLADLNAQNVAAHRQTKQNFRNAMAEAQRLEQARLARVRAEQERINERAQESYDRRVADLRTRYERLRAQGRAGVASAAGAEPMPALPEPAFGTDAEAGADGLSLSERYECSVTALQLDELISWVDAQTKVKVNN